MLQETFLMIKPDGVARKIKNDIFSRIEKTGLAIKVCKLIHMSIDDAEQLYSPHLGKPFYEGLVKYITSAPVVCCIVEGENAIRKVREIMGATDPRQAALGTIRGDLKEDNVINEFGIIKNMVHGSDSEESAKREINIFFKNNIE